MVLINREIPLFVVVHHLVLHSQHSHAILSPRFIQKKARFAAGLAHGIHHVSQKATELELQWQLTDFRQFFECVTRGATATSRAENAKKKLLTRTRTPP